jgi:hypothetical protein
MRAQTYIGRRERLIIPIRPHCAGSYVPDFTDVWATVVEFDDDSITFRIDRGERFEGRRVRVVDNQADWGPKCRCGHPAWFHADGACDFEDCDCKRLDIAPGQRWQGKLSGPAGGLITGLT